MAYRVITKHIFRASLAPTVMGTKADGTPDIVVQPGPIERLEVGTVLEHVTPEELAAFPDRFELVEEGAAPKPDEPLGVQTGETVTTGEATVPDVPAPETPVSDTPPPEGDEHAPRGPRRR